MLISSIDWGFYLAIFIAMVVAFWFMDNGNNQGNTSLT
jgi:hypothetical protein